MAVKFDVLSPWIAIIIFSSPGELENGILVFILAKIKLKCIDSNLNILSR